jgi:hypothetical protein
LRREGARVRMRLGRLEIEIVESIDHKEGEQARKRMDVLLLMLTN